MLFGVESGVTTVLTRFSKETTAEQNVLAIRTLSALGVPTRFTSVRNLHVERFPPVNYGTDITGSEQFIAGDGPIVAGALSTLGDPAVLGSNQVADDAAGHAVLARLRQWGVALAPSTVNASETRANVVICDRDGNRTWFSGLRGVADELAAIDLEALLAPRIAYIDCYEVLGDAPSMVLAAALDAGTDVVLNLGGSPPAPWLKTVIGRRRVGVVQTNADENDAAEAQRTLEALRGRQSLVQPSIGRSAPIHRRHQRCAGWATG